MALFDKVTEDEEFAEENNQDAMPTDIALNANKASEGDDKELGGSQPSASHEGSLITESGVCENVGALKLKRYQIYKRDRTGLCCEVFCPVILVIIGCCLTKIQYLHNTEPIALAPDAWPYQQRMLMNDVAMVDSDASGSITP